MRYFFKLWLFTVLFSPFLFLVEVIRNKSMIVKSTQDGILVWLLGSLAGAALGLPALLIFWLVDKKLVKTHLTSFQTKLIFLFIGLLIVWIAFIILNWKYISIINWSDAFWGIIYSAGLIIGTMIFKSDKRTLA